MRLKAYTIGDTLGSITVSETGDLSRIHVSVRNRDGETTIELNHAEAKQLKEILPGYVIAYDREMLQCKAEEPEVDEAAA